MAPQDFRNLSRLQESSDPSQEVQTALLRAEDELEEIINFLPLGELSADAKVVVGIPIEALVEERKRHDIDLVIMSTHGMTGLRQALPGSVAEQMVRRAACPCWLGRVIPGSYRGWDDLQP